jgi:hypothetical protein
MQKYPTYHAHPRCQPQTRTNKQPHDCEHTMTSCTCAQTLCCMRAKSSLTNTTFGHRRCTTRRSARYAAACTCEALQVAAPAGAGVCPADKGSQTHRAAQTKPYHVRILSQGLVHNYTTTDITNHQKQVDQGLPALAPAERACTHVGIEANHRRGQAAQFKDVSSACARD